MKRDPDTDAANLFSFARDYLHGYLTAAEHIDRAQVSFDHFDRAHLKAWLTWMREQRGYAPRTITLRLTAIKTFLAYCSQEDITLIALSEAAKTLRAPASPKT